MSDRELDIFIAEKVFHAKVWWRSENDGDEVPWMTRCSPHRELPAYSTDLALAFEVVERMRERGWMVTIKNWNYYGDLSWSATFIDSALINKEFTKQDKSLPMVICLAAKQALEQPLPRPSPSPRPEV